MESKHLAILGVILGIILMLLAGHNITEGDKSMWVIIEMIAGIGLFIACITKIN